MVFPVLVLNMRSCWSITHVSKRYREGEGGKRGGELKDVVSTRGVKHGLC